MIKTGMMIDRFMALEPFTMFMVLFMPIAAIIFPIARNFLVKSGKSLKVWVAVSFIPLILCVVHMVLNLYDMNETVTFELFGVMYAAAVSVFTDQTDTMLIMKGTAAHQTDIEIKLSGDGTYKDLPVVALVNAGCGSSGDYLADTLRKMDHVKLVGMTPSMGIGQATGERCMLPGGCQFYFPIVHTFNQSGEPAIDTKADRINRIPLEEKIPATEDLVRRILEGDGDPELDYVVEHCF